MVWPGGLVIVHQIEAEGFGLEGYEILGNAVVVAVESPEMRFEGAECRP
jgi:hypothetical protein